MPEPSASPAWLGQFSRFATAGAVGFGVDLGATILLAPVAGNGPGRIAAILLAVAVTYALNRTITFASANPRIWQEAGRYGLVSAAGATVNFAIYWAVLAALDAICQCQRAPASLVLAVAAGSGVAMACNFLGAKFFTFAK